MKAILSFTLFFAMAMAEAPIYRQQNQAKRQYYFARQQEEANPTAAASYEPSGWKPDGPSFELPQKQLEDSYGPPKDQAPEPQQQYGAPDPQQQYGAPDSEKQYRAPEPQQQYLAPQSQQQYRVPQPQQQYRAPQPQQQYHVPQPQQQYRALQLQQQYLASQAQQRYRAPQPQQQYQVPEPQQEEAAPEPEQHYGAPKAQEQDAGSEEEQQYGAPEQKQQYGAPEAQRQDGASDPEQQYGAPEVPQQYGAPEAQKQYGAPEPEQEYGPPPTTTTELPTTTEAEEPSTTFTPEIDSEAEPVNSVNELDDEGDVDEPQQQQQSGEYYVALPDGRLQRIQYVSRQDVEAMKYFARIQAENVEPLRGPIFAYSPLQQLQFPPAKLQVAPLVAPVAQAAPAKLVLQPAAAAGSSIAVPAKLELQPSNMAAPVAAQVQYQYGAPAVLPLTSATASGSYTAFRRNYQVPAPETRYLLSFQ